MIKNGFLSHKELASKYDIHPNTLANYLRKSVPFLYQLKNAGRRGAKMYSPAELKIIFSVLGEP